MDCPIADPQGDRPTDRLAPTRVMGRAIAV